jgi:hypothetical protein
MIPRPARVNVTSPRFGTPRGTGTKACHDRDQRKHDLRGGAGHVYALPDGRYWVLPEPKETT